MTKVDWEKELADEQDPDDEQIETPGDVTAVLGFDPAEEPDDDESGPAETEPPKSGWRLKTIQPGYHEYTNGTYTFLIWRVRHGGTLLWHVAPSLPDGPGDTLAKRPRLVDVVRYLESIT